MWWFPPRKGMGFAEGDGWGEPGQTLTSVGLPWCWHLLADGEMLRAAGVGGHQQICTCAGCVQCSRQLFQTYAWFSSPPPSTHSESAPYFSISPFHLPTLSILCTSGTHNWVRVEHLFSEGAFSTCHHGNAKCFDTETA